MRTDAVRFLLDDEVVELRDVPPTRTVLEYLREDLGRTGTREGCAEGDCGACTVAVVEADASGGLRTRAVNACIQFLPTLHGKQLLTVESLGKPGSLHPVQAALVEQHASQCGFCTPGFAMSLFALYKHNAAPTRDDINVALSGNLCRCTGYRPIVDAASAMYEPRLSDPARANTWLHAPAGARAADAVARVDALRELSDSRVDLSLDGPSGQFHAPATLEALDALLEAMPYARLLAGGTDVGLWVTKQYRELGPVIYLGRVEALGASRVTDSHVEIGAGVTFSDAMPLLLEHFAPLDELLRRFASPPIRNAATLGGNIANGSPIGDSMPALIALGASIELRHGATASTREVALEDFYIDYGRTALEPGEVVVKVRIPRLATRSRFAAYKISKRFDQDISAVCAAFMVELDESGHVMRARSGFGGVAAIPSRARGCEAALTGQPWDEGALQRACDALTADFTPIDDMRASARYRRVVAANLLRRFWLESTGAPARLGTAA